MFYNANQDDLFYDDAFQNEPESPFLSSTAAEHDSDSEFTLTLSDSLASWIPPPDLLSYLSDSDVIDDIDMLLPNSSCEADFKKFKVSLTCLLS